jgi:hypothetical protein
MKLPGFSIQGWVVIGLLTVAVTTLLGIAHLLYQRQAAEDAAMQRERQREVAEAAAAEKAHQKMLDDIKNQEPFKLLR